MVIQAGLAVSSLAYGAELLTSDLGLKMIYVFFRYVGSYMLLLGTLFFALWYTGLRQWLNWRRIFVVGLPAWVSLAVIASKDLRRFYYPVIWLVWESDIPQLAHSTSFLYHLVVVYVLCVIFATFCIFVSCQLINPRVYGPGITLMTGGYLVVVIGYLVYLSGFRPFGFMNLMYYFSAVNAITLTVAVVYHGVHIVRPLGYGALVRDLPLGVVLFDRDMHVVEVNSMAVRILNPGATEPLTERRMPDIIPQGEGGLDVQAIRRVGIMETRLNGMDLLCTMSDIRNHMNEIVGTSLLLQDITVRKRTEEALRANEEKYRFLVANMHGIVYTINKDGIFAFVSQGWTALLGHPVEEVVGKSYREFVHPDDIGRYEEFLLRVIETGQRQIGVEYRVGHAGGSWRWHTSNVVPMRDRTGKVFGFEGSASDIHERKLMEAQLQNLNINLQRKVDEEMERRLTQERLLANQARMAAMGRMIGAIAHQWRQPLSTLSMMVQRIHAIGTMQGLRPDQLDDFKTGAMRQVRYMSDTIDEFRNFYSPKKVQEPFLPYDCISQAIKLLAPQFVSNRITADLICCPEDVCLSTSGYPNEFKQVLLNLLSNARDSILEHRTMNGAPAEGRIVVDMRANPEEVLTVDISDNGGGVPESVTGQIFDPYFTTKEQSGGTGIGLYMSRMIMEENMRGSLILVHSTEGATFRIKLPLKEKL